MKPKTLAILLEDFRQSKFRLEDDHGGIELESGGLIEFEENVEPAVFDGAEQDTIITEDNNRLVHTIYETIKTKEYIITHNGSTESTLQMKQVKLYQAS